MRGSLLNITTPGGVPSEREKAPRHEEKERIEVLVDSLTSGEYFCILFDDRGVEQLVARRAHNPKVAGSSPVPATGSKEESLSRKW